MANNPDHDQKGKPSYHEVPASRYIFLFETAIHKRFFLYWTAILTLSTYIGTRFINLDYMTLNFLTVHYWITPAIVVPVCLIAYADYRIGQRRKPRTITYEPEAKE